MTRLVRHLGALLIGLVILVGIAAPASAVEATNNTDIAAASFVTAKGSGASQGAVCASSNTVDLEALPAYRWGDATGNMHTRYSATDLTNVQDRVVSVAFTGVGFSIGNAAWQSTIRLIEIANRACPLDAIGGLVDKNAAKIGNAIMKSGIVAGLVAFSIVAIAFRGLRGGGASWKSMGPKVMALGFFAILLAGSTQSTGGGINGSTGNYKPGVGSPGWFAVTVDRTISELTAAPVAALTDDSGNLGVGSGKKPGNKGGKDDYQNSCRFYVNGLNEIYSESYGSKTSDKALASVPKAMSGMWEVSGLRAWRKAQFGAKNYAGNHMYCYALEKEIDAPVERPSAKAKARSGSLEARYSAKGNSDSSISSVLDRMGMKAPKDTSFVWYRTSNNDLRDMQLVALAQCRAKNTSWTNWDIYQLADPKAKDDRYKISKEMCTEAFTADVFDKDNAKFIEENFDAKKAAGFNWPPNERDSGAGNAIADGLSGGAFGGSNTIDKYASTDGNRDFLRALHGDASGTSIVLTIAFVISSVLIFLAFGLIAFALLIAKITALMVIFGLYFVLLAMMMPNADSSKIGKFAKQYIGLSFFIFGFQLLLGILVLLTKLMIQMGDQSFGNNDFISLLWVGLAPVVSLFAMHIMFKKMGMPSPVSMNAGQSWGKAAAAGAIGGAAGGALGAGLMSNLQRGAAHKAGSAATNYAGSKVKGTGPGGRNDRANRMQPGQSGKGHSDRSELTGAGGLGADGLGAAGAAAAGGAALASVAGNGKGGDPTLGEAMSEEAKTKAAAARERKAARDEHKSETTAGGRAKSKAGQAMNKARENMKNKPVRTLGAAALIGGGLAVAGPAVLLAPAMYKGTKKSVAAVGTSLNMDTATNRDAMARSAVRKNQASVAAEQQESEQRAKAAQAKSVEKNGDNGPGAGGGGVTPPSNGPKSGPSSGSPGRQAGQSKSGRNQESATKDSGPSDPARASAPKGDAKGDTKNEVTRTRGNTSASTTTTGGTLFGASAPSLSEFTQAAQTSTGKGSRG